MISDWILVGLLSLSTYISRIIGVEIMAGKELKPTLKEYFNYVPVAIISALIVKQILVPADGQLTISLPVFIGCLFTTIAIKITKRFLPPVIIGIIIGLLVRSFLK